MKHCITELKELLSNKYTLIEHPNKGHKNFYCLHDNNTTSIYSNIPYVATIKIIPKGYMFNSELYKTVEELSKAINDYNKTLEYPTDFYDPWLNDWYKEQSKLAYYIKSLGFEETNWEYFYGNEYRTYAIKDIYDIDRFRFTVSFKGDSMKGQVFISSNNSLISVDFNDLGSAIKAVNTILKPNLLYLLPVLIDLGTNNESINIDKLTKSTVHNMSILTSPMKTLIKEKLTEILNTLK